MTVQTAETAVQRSVVVRTPIEHAFRTFTEDIGGWWPHDHHLIKAPLAGMVFEPYPGGHIYDCGTDGSECRWARVLAYEPPNRVVFSWDISLRWEIETDPERTSEIEVRFTAQGETQTLVELEHRHLDRHGEGWETMRDAVGSTDGWSLQPFANYAEARAA